LPASPPNLHRSFMALLAGNLIAIPGGAIVSLALCQVLFVDFYEEFATHSKRRSEVKAEQLELDAATKTKGPQREQSGQVGDVPMSDSNDLKKPSEDPDEADRLVFPIGFLGVILICDLAFSFLGGFVCTRIAGFARNNHVMLLALFLALWKFQQLLGTVENQVPPLLLTIEMVLVPMASVIGSTFVAEQDAPAEDDDPSDGAQE
jgi:hypothetical protein